MSSNQGVLYDVAQNIYGYIAGGYLIGAKLHLITGPQVVSRGDFPPGQYTIFVNSGYAPVTITVTNLHFFSGPGEPHYQIQGVIWNLGPPTPGYTTVTGWWIEADGGPFPTALYGGLFATPITIPSAGMTLTVGPIDLFLHDCGVPPPPPPPPAPYLRDTFAGTPGTLLPAHTMDVGPGWISAVGAVDLELGSGTAVASVNGNCADITDTGAAAWVLRLTYTHQNDSRPILLYRYQDSNNAWYSFYNGTAWNVTGTVAGVQTQWAIGSLAMTAGVTHEITLVVDGPNVALLVDGAVGVNYSGMTTTLTATKLGLWVFPSGATIPTASYANLRVDAV